MAYTPREIKDRVAVGDDIFIVEDLGNNRIRLIPAPTHVSEAGTPVNKALLQPIEDYLATGVVPVERTITAGNGLTGGGSLTTNRTLSLGTPSTISPNTTNNVTSTSHTHAVSGLVPSTREIEAGTGLTGGGDLSVDRTLSVNFGTTAGTVCEGNDSRLSNARPPTAHNHAAGDLPSTYTLLDHFINSGEIETAQIAGIKNSLYRGKNLGTSYTSAQQSQVASGKFLDLWVGDYWVINGTRYYIAAFNYYYNTGDTNLITNHITLVPATSMYTHRMNPQNSTQDGYVGSEMYTTGLGQARTKIHADFPGRVVIHRRHLSTGTSNGYPNAGGWFNSDAELMNEVMVYGNVVNGNEAFLYNIGTEKSQLPLFSLRPDLICIRARWWLRDICGAAYFAIVDHYGRAVYDGASVALGVRPVFSIS